MRVFLSHADEDRVLASKLAKGLENAGLDVWSVGKDAFLGDNVPLMVGKALARSDAMVVLVSPASARSRYVHDEINYALCSQRYSNRVIPVVVRPTKGLPWILGEFKAFRMGKDTDRLSRNIAAQLRQAKESDN